MASVAAMVKDIGPVRLGLIALSALVVSAAMIILALRLSHPATVPLFSNLDAGDSANILTRLERMGIYYEVEEGGARIMVPVNKVLSARMQLAEQGLPASGATIGYEIFDREDALGVSNFVYNVNLVRALEGELGRTISAFDKIGGARVHLVLPRRDLFSRSKQDPSASVVLQMKGIEPLTRGEIDAISHLVATAVPDLDITNITIVDTKGRPFKKGAEDPSSPDYIASAADEYRVKLERRLEENIESLLERSVGVGLVEAEVNAIVDFDRVITDSETYDPEGQVARSTQNSETRETSVNRNGEQISVETNLPGAEQTSEAARSEAETERIDNIVNFEVSKTTSRYVKGLGAVKQLSVAVLVDGIYRFDDEEDEYVYQPRSEEELNNLRALVRNAIGFDETRGDKLEIVNMEFSREIRGMEPERPFEWLKRDLGSVVQTLMIGIIITLIIVLLIKPLVSRAFDLGRTEKEDEAIMHSALTDKELQELREITAAEEEEIRAKSTDNDNWVNLEEFEENLKDSSLDAINQIIDRHPNEALAVLRSWMETAE